MLRRPIRRSDRALSATSLYTPRVLELAIALAAYPLGPAFEKTAQARSPTCGSTVEMGLCFDSAGMIESIGLRSQACAIGQASAAIFAAAAKGRCPQEIRRGAQAVIDWLDGAAPLPDWPGMDAIAVAPDYPARHGAVLLPWKAALQLLP